MKRLILAIIVSLAIVGMAWATDSGTTEYGVPKAQKQKSIEELQWQAKALQNEYNYLQERLKMLNLEFQAVQAEIKKLTPTPTPKPVEKPKVEPDKKK